MPFSFNSGRISFRRIYRFQVDENPSDLVNEVINDFVKILEKKKIEIVYREVSRVSFGAIEYRWPSVGNTIAGGELILTIENNMIVAVYEVKIGFLAYFWIFALIVLGIAPAEVAIQTRLTAVSIGLAVQILDIAYLLFRVDGLITQPLYNQLDSHQPIDIPAEQKKWMEDPNLCPACGTKIVRGEKKCHSCGLFLE